MFSLESLPGVEGGGRLHKGILALSGLGFLYKILPESFFFFNMFERGRQCIEEEVGPFLKRGSSGTWVFSWNSPNSRKLLEDILFASKDKRY